MYNLQTRNQAEILDQLDEATNQLHLSQDIPSVSLNFIPCQEVEKMEAVDFFHEKLGQ